MELSEKYIAQLEKEEFDTVYEHYDEPNTSYPTHSHKEEHTIIVVEGSMKVLIDIDMKTFHAHDRFVIPRNVEHSVSVGPKGCKYVIGEK